MRTALDTSVLLDVLTGDETFGTASREALRKSYDAGSLVASDVVWAEVRAHFAGDDAFETAMEVIGVSFDPTSAAAATLAGRLWRDRARAARKHGAANDASQPKRVVADFLVGAHAVLQADVLLARDRGFYRGYFKGLRIVDPSQAE